LVQVGLSFWFGVVWFISVCDCARLGDKYYAFLASRLQSGCLQTKLLRHYDIVTSGSAFDNALSTFNAKIEIDLLSNPTCSRVFVADIYEDHVVSCDGIVGHAVIEAAQRKRVKYEAKCAYIGYGFLSFSFSSFGELEKDAVTLLKRIRRFSVTQDTGTRAVVHIFNRIGFAIDRGVGVR
nr:putative reverse transcriptase domain-containing protein [Tanacetum cinerariifolium]GEY79038.1 putative reverse transcriptase domain-containing protein [Tanacetum cinerariifolium]